MKVYLRVLDLLRVLNFLIYLRALNPLKALRLLIIFSVLKSLYSTVTDFARLRG